MTDIHPDRPILAFRKSPESRILSPDLEGSVKRRKPTKKTSECCAYTSTRASSGTDLVVERGSSVHSPVKRKRGHSPMVLPLPKRNLGVTGRTSACDGVSCGTFEYLECVALVNEVLLPLGRVVHLRRVCADQCVEERVETTVHVRLHEYRHGRWKRREEDEAAKKGCQSNKIDDNTHVSFFWSGGRSDIHPWSDLPASLAGCAKERVGL